MFFQRILEVFSVGNGCRWRRGVVSHERHPFRGDADARVALEGVRLRRDRVRRYPRWEKKKHPGSRRKGFEEENDVSHV